MGSYQLIKENINPHLQGNKCTLRIEGRDDVESALPNLDSSSSPILGCNAAPRCIPSASGTTRLVSLDIFRGLTVALMILVDNVGGFFPAINHSPWNGLTLADTVMPFFLFMVGVSLGLAYKNQLLVMARFFAYSRGTIRNLYCRIIRDEHCHGLCNYRGAASKKAMLRALKLLALGVFLQGGYFHGISNLTYGVDMYQIRWMGILQRIAIAYFLAAACEIWLRNDDKVNSELSLLKKYQRQWIVVLMLTALYLLLLYGLYVPDWEYQIPIEASSSAKLYSVKCGVRGDTGPACNAAGMIDRKILGIHHLYRRPIYARTKQCSINSPDYGPLPPDAPSWCQAPFDPEGILSTAMATASCLIGLQYGHIIVHFKDHKTRLLQWFVQSCCLVVLAVICDICGMHINKALYSFSYMCFTTGAAGILFAAIYIMVDMYGYRRLTVVLEWMGKHALMIFILVACNVVPLILHGFYWGQPHNNILTSIGIGARG